MMHAHRRARDPPVVLLRPAMSDTLAKRPRANDPQSTASPPSISGVTVWVLVRTSDREYGDRCKWECDANSEVVGVYASEALARKAKKIESRGMDSKDDVNFHRGECYYTTLVIHAKRIQDSVRDDDDDDDDDDDEDDDDDDDDDDNDGGDDDDDDGLDGDLNAGTRAGRSGSGSGGHEVIVIPDDD